MSVKSRAVSTASSNKILGFDGLRAIGFLLVFVSHKVASPTTEMLGSLGVWLFFCLSGFLITRIVYKTSLQVDQKGIAYSQALTRIFIARISRICPVYFALLAIITLLSTRVHIQNFSFIEQLAYWTFTTNIYVAHHGWIGQFGHLWSLAAEMQYYAIFPAVVLMTSASRTWRTCISFVVCGIVVHAALAFWGANSALLDVHPTSSFAMFGLGGIAGLCADKGIGKAIAKATVIPVLGIIYLSIPLWFVSYHVFIWFGPASVFIASILLCLVYYNQGSAYVSALEFRPLRYLGKISYGSYLIHNFLNLSFLSGTTVMSAIGVISLEFIITIGLASLSFHLMEKPIRDFARTALARSKRVSNHQHLG